MRPEQLGLHDLVGKVVVITGSGQGIGCELAKVLASLGAKIVVAELSSAGEKVVDEISLHGGDARYICTDVADQASVSVMAAQVRQTYGTVDVLVNNAIISPVGPFLEMTISEWDRTIAINLRGAVLTAREFVPSMVEQGSGVLVNMVSAPSMPYMAAYAATKQALESFTHSLAGELEDSGVQCIAFGPGMVDTPGGYGAFHKLAPYLKLSYEQLIQSGINPGYPGLIPAYDVAVALAYVISNAPSYHNQTVMVSDVMDKMALAVNYDAENVGDANLNEYQEKQFAHLSLISEPLAKLQEWIIATDDEFDRLPFFARPLARTGFRRKVGISIGDCKELLGLAIGSQSSQDGPVTDISTFGQNDVSASGYALVNAGPNLPTGMIASRLRSILPGLITYYHEVPKETARFVRDPELLKQITQVAQERAETCGALAKVLDHNIS